MTKEESQRKRLSKFLSLLLRHRPARFPIQLDNQGYADLNEVMYILRGLPNFRWATRADVKTIAETADRRRFEITGNRIRACYGHTAIRPDYEPAVPPAVLYHGTAPENLESIRREGLSPMERQYVHLATTPALARTIALRHTPNPIILTIDAASAHAAGIPFYHPTEPIYLSETLPPTYIQINA